MKRATKGDKAEWLEKPSDVVMVNVCRMSGKLPGAGCDSVQVVTKDGQIETKSMIYGEYFARGTLPTTTCPLHESLSVLDRLAGAFGKDNHVCRCPPTIRACRCLRGEHQRQCRRGPVKGRREGRRGTRL